LPFGENAGWGCVNASSNPYATMALQLARHRFTAGAYDLMVAKGILTADDRVELLDGEIVDKVTIGSSHAACVDRLTRFFSKTLSDRAIVRVQGPLALPPHSQPEPDLSLLHPREDFYAMAHPGPADAFLVVEVADASLALDRTLKLRLYANAGIEEYWIVNLLDRCVERFIDPRGDVYAGVHTFGTSEMIAPHVFPEALLRVAEIVPSLER
jgi:Uma2 family endonuclease